MNPIERIELSDALRYVMRSMPDRARSVLVMRFGLHGEPGMTYREIGEELRVSGKRVQQIVQRELRRLRYPARAKHLRAFIGRERTAPPSMPVAAAAVPAAAATRIDDDGYICESCSAELIACGDRWPDRCCERCAHRRGSTHVG